MEASPIAAAREISTDRTMPIVSVLEEQSNNMRNDSPKFVDEDEEEDFELETDEPNAPRNLLGKEGGSSRPRSFSRGASELGNQDDRTVTATSTSVVTERIHALREEAAETDEALQKDRAFMTALRSEHNSMLARLDELERETCHAAEVWEAEESARLSVATTNAPLKRKRSNQEEVHKSSRRKLGEFLLLKTTHLVGTTLGTVVGTVAFHHFKGNINAWDLIKAGAKRMI